MHQAAIKNEILIIDDQAEFAELLKDRLSAMMKNSSNKISIKIVKDIQNYKQFLTDSVLTIFLDIQMPISGFDIAKEVNHLRIPVIFISNYEALVFDALLYQPFYFIRKKFLTEDLDKIKSWLMKKAVCQLYQLIENNISISICIDKIDMIRSYGNYIELITDNHIYKERKTLQSICSDPRFSHFLMPARGFLVNYHSIVSIKKDCILMKNNDQIHISRNRYKSFYEAYYHLLGGEFNES